MVEAPGLWSVDIRQLQPLVVCRLAVDPWHSSMARVQLCVRPAVSDRAQHRTLRHR